MEREPQVTTLQEISNSLLIKGHGEDYIEAEEKVHVIEKKLKQLLEQVSQDLMSLQGSQVSPLVAFKYTLYQMQTRKWYMVASLWEGGCKQAICVEPRVLPLPTWVALES